LSFCFLFSNRKSFLKQNFFFLHNHVTLFTMSLLLPHSTPPCGAHYCSSSAVHQNLKLHCLYPITTSRCQSLTKP
jgi:hypothetical protein